MFGYYGSKSKLVHLYPPPAHDKIIEPFAGSARYSLRHYQNDVTLIDKYKLITDIWKWLQQCTEKDILRLPIPQPKDDIRDIKFITEVERNFLGFFIATGQAKPNNIVTKMEGVKPQSIERALIKCSKQLHKIKHWKIINASYEDHENIEATWFIDPPYQYGGEHQYKFNNKQIDFIKLAEWCRTRNGQVIVCENMKADWLPFTPVKSNPGANFTNTMEAMWTNAPNRDNKIYKPVPLFDL